MRRETLLTISLAVALVFMLALANSGEAREIKTELTTLTGTIHCIGLDGKLHIKAGVCPADHIAHVIITEDGRAVMLGGSEKMEKLIRNLSLPAGTKVKVRGQMAEELSAIDMEELIIGIGAAGE